VLAGRLLGLTLAATTVVPLLAAGCAATRAPLVEAFPPGSVASPWHLQGEVWTGPFDEAAPALGDDAETWNRFKPERAWLAVYCHESEAQRCIRVRCVSFASVDEARRAFLALQPLEVKPFQAGDEVCWTEIGVLFRWERLVFDIFGDEASWGSQVQASYIAAVLGKRMPRGAPEDPR
jgi:hypothetical protein